MAGLPRSFSLIAHRGDSSHAPENTRPAFERALVLPVDYIELDYHVSLDEQMVVIHDALLNRTTNAGTHADFGPNAPVRSYPWEKLKQLNAADWPERRWVDHPPTPLLLLQDALDLIVVRGKCRCIIEAKADDASAKALCDLIQQLGLTDRVIATGASWPFLNECRAILPGLRLAYQLSADHRQDMSLAQTGQIIFCEHTLLSQSAVQRFREKHQLETWAWTVNDIARAEMLSAWGVIGICSDLPAKVGRYP